MARTVAATLAVEIEQATSASDEVRAVIAELDEELAEHYDEVQRHGLSLDALFQPHVRFFVARSGGAAVGCGGIALFADFAEVKRMYVRPDARGKGVADVIIAKLTVEVLDAGLSILRLETGTHQVAALRFYRRCGFQACDAFEPYASMPTEAIAQSVFMEKQLTRDR